MNPQRELIPTEPFGLVAWLKETRVALPLKGVECRFEATGPLLSVEIDQIFHQDHAEPLDCLYSFPLPSGAAEVQTLTFVTLPVAEMSSGREE